MPAPMRGKRQMQSALAQALGTLAMYLRRRRRKKMAPMKDAVSATMTMTMLVDAASIVF